MLDLFMKSAFSYLLIILLLGGCTKQLITSSNIVKPKNIILLIGDGMGPAHIKALRMFKDDPATPFEEPLVFDSYLVGSINSNPKDSRENITDSAASATAYATGQKTTNGALSVDYNNQKMLTVFEVAKQQGKSTGLVVTSQVTHATPAAFFAHQIDRENENNIADQLFDNQFQSQPIVDVLLGGGLKFLKRSDRDITKDFVTKGYQLVENRKELLASNNEHLLGLFADEGLAKMWDRNSNTPSLAEMTLTAIKQLSKNSEGFILLVEGSQIDWAAHANDIVGVISEMQDFEQAAKVAIDFARGDGNTLVIATADHETGGLSIGSYTSGNDYFWNVDVLRSFKSTPAKITTDAQQSGDLIAEFHRATSLSLTEKEEKQLRKADLTHWDKTRELVSQIISDRSYTGWSTYGHTGVDVFLYAYGPQSEALKGYWDNTKIGHFIFEQLKPD